MVMPYLGDRILLRRDGSGRFAGRQSIIVERHCLTDPDPREVRRCRPRDRVPQARRGDRSRRPGSPRASGGHPRRDRRHCRDKGAGPDRFTAGRAVDGQGPGHGATYSLGRRQPPGGPCRLGLPGRGQARISLCRPRRLRRAYEHLCGRGFRPDASRRADARRRGRRGLRQGGKASGYRLSRRRGHRPPGKTCATGAPSTRATRMSCSSASVRVSSRTPRSVSARSCSIGARGAAGRAPGRRKQSAGRPFAATSPTSRGCRRPRRRRSRSGSDTSCTASRSVSRSASSRAHSSTCRKRSPRRLDLLDLTARRPRLGRVEPLDRRPRVRLRRRALSTQLGRRRRWRRLLRRGRGRRRAAGAAASARGAVS